MITARQRMTLTVGAAGIAHLVAGLPTVSESFDELLAGGGVVGYLATTPLASLLTPWPVWALMVVLVLFGLLLGLTGAGGSLVALPLLLSLHLPLRDAIGVSLGAVALTALIGAMPRARQGQVAWLPVLLLSLAGLPDHAAAAALAAGCAELGLSRAAAAARAGYAIG